MSAPTPALSHLPVPPPEQQNITGRWLNSSSLPGPPSPPRRPLFVRTSLSLSIRVIRTVLAGSCRPRRDGRGKVELRETHPEIDDTAGLIPVNGAVSPNYTGPCVRTHRRISSRSYAVTYTGRSSANETRRTEKRKRDKGIAPDHASAISLASAMKRLGISA